MEIKSTFISAVSQLEFPNSDKITANSIRPSILELIQKDHPNLGIDDSLSLSELNYYREKYVSNFLISEVGELSDLEATVLASLTDRGTITDKVEDDQIKSTVGQKLADKVASFGGSWTFITIFGAFIVIWIFVNVYFLINKGFDPYPFILLNLILSCIAAIQAPVIMMSQNRQEEKDRDRSKKDYMINLKSELEIRILHEKIDHLIMHQQQELLEIQKEQISMMNDILSSVKQRANES
jgi:uncharacterized membrane protein